MGGVGSGRTVGSKNAKRGYPRVAPFTDAIKIDLWQLYRDGLLGGGEGVYEVEHKGEVVGIRVKSIAGGVNICGVDVAITSGRLPANAVAARLHARYRFICPGCEVRRMHLYVYDGTLGCQSCLGLYLPAYSMRYSAKFLVANYEKMKAEVERLTAVYDNYLTRSWTRSEPWKRIGQYASPRRFKNRLDNLQHQLKLCELKLWQRAASDKSAKAA